MTKGFKHRTQLNEKKKIRLIWLLSCLFPLSPDDYGVLLQGSVSIDLTAGIDGASGTISLTLTNTISILSFQIQVVGPSGEPLLVTLLQFDTPTQPSEGSVIADGGSSAPGERVEET